MSEARLILGDCLDELRSLDAASVDAVVTDPPYGLSFMGKHWDRFDIERRVGKRDVSQLGVRLTGGADDPNRKVTSRTASAFANAAGEAGGYDFTLRGNRAFQEWCETWGAECLRVLKPGGHLLVFGGTRTYHRLACGLEDAGFEIRDEILAWMFGQGFPKSLNVAKAIDSGTGRPEDIRRAAMGDDYEPSGRGRVNYDHGAGSVMNGADSEGELSAGAEPWDGWGTALKPAHEPILVARKPLAGTVAANVLAHGTGALNIDGCRIGFVSDADESESKEKNRHADFESGARENQIYGADNRERGEQGNYDPTGRWPANVVLMHADECRQVGTATVDSNGHFPAARPGGIEIGTVGHAGQDGLDERHTKGEVVETWECVEDCPVRVLDEQAGDLGISAGGRINKAPGANDNTYGGGWQEAIPGDPGYGDRGGPSRFFYCAKVSRAERNAGLEGFDAKMLRWSSGDQSPGTFQGEGTDKTARNNHPTVKPIALMRWLCRLVTPPGGLVLDPFLGSGTAGIAAELEGFRFIGIEREADYMKIAEARLRFWAEHGEDGLRICAERDGLANVRKAREDAGQLSLLT